MHNPVTRKARNWGKFVEHLMIASQAVVSATYRAAIPANQLLTGRRLQAQSIRAVDFAFFLLIFTAIYAHVISINPFLSTIALILFFTPQILPVARISLLTRSMITGRKQFLADQASQGDGGNSQLLPSPFVGSFTSQISISVQRNPGWRAVAHAPDPAQSPRWHARTPVQAQRCAGMQ
jgi:hypothetical protein